VTAEDTAILDRVERLAYQAGVGASGRCAPWPEPKPVETKPLPEHPLIVKLRKISRQCPSNTGGCAYANDAADTLTWEEIHADRIMYDATHPVTG
jgi:hypothetical protein